MVIPTPLANINYAYGFNEKTTLFGGLHLTSLAYGNFQTDIGATFKVWEQDGFIPNISVSPCLNFISHVSTKATKLWPQADLNAYWEFGEYKSYLYAGLSNWFELSATRVHNENSLDHWLMNPQFGYVFKHKTWAYTIEMKLLGLSHDNTHVFVPYRTITGNKGATALFIGASKRF